MALLVVIGPDHKGRVFVALFSSDHTLRLLKSMENSILNSVSPNLNCLDVFVFFSQRRGPAPGNIRSGSTPCPSDKRHGLCCRVDWAMPFILKGETYWFLGAIDDRCFNPDNLYGLIEQF
jgi:hypothetical protein